ncbi:MAG TPA: hypothetical protein ENI73_08070 [Spirochaetes bacterium]|nr:hypothetical protein [Spirochaetota bacterium]
MKKLKIVFINSSQYWVYFYLSDRYDNLRYIFIDPVIIGKDYFNDKNIWSKGHTDWAIKICEELKDKGLLDKNRGGCYRVKRNNKLTPINIDKEGKVIPNTKNTLTLYSKDGTIIKAFPKRGGLCSEEREDIGSGIDWHHYSLDDLMIGMVKGDYDTFYIINNKGIVGDKI